MLALMFFIIIRKLRYEADLAENMTWKIRFEDLKMKGKVKQEPKPQGMLPFWFNNIIMPHQSAAPSGANSTQVSRNSENPSAISDLEGKAEYAGTTTGECHVSVNAALFKVIVGACILFVAKKAPFSLYFFTSVFFRPVFWPISTYREPIKD